ncbi:FtsH protease activity modulator HflK [Woodsholea maritima]|uniref:FtsH protease activity modulator HflK n=1 Tax=Woodsholea maritima TaxID=240237 RepID=UPI00035CF204|nr:FtsH protease activity modulator HflK [Woodsholea maritima]
MPWNDNAGGGGPWGSGGGNRKPDNKNPWGQGPNGGGRGPNKDQEPDLDDLIAQLDEGLRRLFGGGKRGPGGAGSKGKGPGGFLIIGLLLLGVMVWLASSSWYIVGPQQEGVVLRFGQYSRSSEPGFQLKLPSPIETVLLPPVASNQEEYIGRTASGANVDSESLMLTRDENIVDIDAVIQWRIATDSVQDFLFNVEDPQAAVKAVTESALREVVGNTNLETLQTSSRAQVAEQTRTLVQETLDEYQAGITILNVQLARADPPAGPVIEAFDNVVAAAQVAESLQLAASQEANRIIPEARGEAVQTVQRAEGYRQALIAEATGEAEAFNAVYAQYALAPEVTRQRLFLERMESVYSRSNLIILDNSAGAVPYLPLDQLTQNRGAQNTSSGGQ